jgi:pimeloyl-ACP methyl ester carboxylesterase
MSADVPSQSLSPQRFPGSGGITLTADVGGNPRGVSVILLHGGGQTRHSWGRTAQDLGANGYHVVSVDLRGHGDSDRSADANYSMDAQVADLRAVIRSMPNPPVLIGASMGGLVSLITTGESPRGLVRALILVDITPKVDPRGRERIIAFMRNHREGFVSPAEAADAIADFLPHRPRPKDLSGLHRNLRHRANGRWYWHWDPRLFDTFEPDADAAELRYTAAAQSVRVPTLLVRGSKSELVKPEHVQHFRQSIPQAEYVDVAGATHMIAGDRNDGFNSAVLEFLTRRAPATNGDSQA